MTINNSPLDDYSEMCIAGIEKDLRNAMLLVECYRGALEDILTADETSTLSGAIAIAKHALEKHTVLYRGLP